MFEIKVRLSNEERAKALAAARARGMQFDHYVREVITADVAGVLKGLRVLKRDDASPRLRSNEEIDA